jgi:hypothetical protein
VLAAETALTSDLAARDGSRRHGRDHVAEIDAELRDHAVSPPRAGFWDRRLRRCEALDAVCAELYGSGSAEARNGSGPLRAHRPPTK